MTHTHTSKFVFFKKILFLVILVIVSSCQEDSLVNSPENFNLTLKSSDIFSDINSITINNGLSNPGNKNNILLFPSFEKYQEIIDKLDSLIDEHNDAFEAKADPNLSDEDYEQLALSSGFEEDQPLLDFEKSLNFSSLRKKILEDELNWLSSQTDTIWNADEDPDNHHIFDDTERSLLNIGSEFIVGTSRENYVIHKILSNCVAIKILDLDLDLLRLINIDPMGYIENTTNYPENLMVIIADGCAGNGGSGGGGSCKSRVDYRKYFSTGSETKIKTIDKIKEKVLSGDHGIAGSVLKSKTKYYRKNTGIFGGWRKGITTISVEIQGSYNNFCSSSFKNVSPNLKKTAKRHKVKVKAWYEPGLTDYYAIRAPNKLFGVHKRRADVVKTIDFYNGQVH